MSFLDGFTDQQEKPSVIDVLLDLLQKENIELKTDLNISQIEVLWKQYFFTKLLSAENEEKDPYRILWESLEYFMLLMTSLKRQRSKEIIDGVKNMKPELFEEVNFLKSLSRR